MAHRYTLKFEHGEGKAKVTSEEVHVSDQQALVIELMQALESGVHGEELRRFFHDDAEQIEYPSLVDPEFGAGSGWHDRRQRTWCGDVGVAAL